MAKHTPGPWKVTSSDDDPYGDITVGRKHRGVCSLWLDDAPEHDYNAEQRANARLIAAAPDLLAACEAMLATWGTDDEEVVIQSRELALAAIAKATGATP